MNRRYMALLLVALLLPCCIAVPAKAADTSPVMVNLLPAFNYQIRVNGSYSDYATPFTNVANATNVVFTWEASTNVRLDYIYLTVNCNVTPAAVDLYLNGSDVTLTETTPFAVNGSFKQYRFGVYGYDFSSLFFGLNFGPSYTGAVSVFSCFGVTETAEVISSVDYSVYHRYVDSYDVTAKTDLIREKFDQDLPFDYLHAQIYYDEFGHDELIFGHMYLTLSPSSHKLQFADSVTFMLVSSSYDYISASLINPNTGAVVAVLDPDSVWYEMDSVVMNAGFDIAYDYCQVTLDLSGYDLSELDIRLCVTAEDHNVSASVEMQEGFYFGCVGITMCPPYEDLPWYTAFGNWLGDKLSGITDTIATWGQKIVDAITGGDSDTSAADTLKEQGQQMQQYEQQHQAVLENSLSTFQSSTNLTGFATALSFVGNYTTNVYSALGEYQIIFTLPLTIGLVLFLASRVRGYDKPQKNNKPAKEVKAKQSKAVGKVSVSGVKQ